MNESRIWPRFRLPRVLVMACIPVGSAAATAVVSVRAERSSVVPSMPGAIWATISVEGSSCSMPIILSLPIIPAATASSSSVSRIHSRNCVRATSATPMILPNMSSVALTLDTSTSTTRELFSSMTELITMPENRAINI